MPNTDEVLAGDNPFLNYLINNHTDDETAHCTAADIHLELIEEEVGCPIIFITIR